MRDFIDRFSLESIKFDAQTGIALALIWLVILGCAWASVCERFSSTRKRVLWLLMIIFLPVIGLLIYLPFALHLDKYPDLLIWRKPGGKPNT